MIRSSEGKMMTYQQIIDTIPINRMTPWCDDWLFVDAWYQLWQISRTDYPDLPIQIALLYKGRRPE
jgi:hypothetical protein